MGFLILDNRAYYRDKTISRWDKFVVTIWNFVSCWKFGHDVIGWIGGKNKWNSQRTAIIGYDKGKEISYKNISRWKQNLIYCGILQEEWGEFEKKFILIKTKYDGLVSVETFNRANKGKIFVKFEDVNTIKILYNQQTDRTIKRRQKFNPDYIFKNIILCSICKKTLKASASKSKSGNMFPLIIVVEITIMSDILNKNLKIML
jgi:hypothetical protein